MSCASLGADERQEGTGVVKDRIALMKSLGESMKAIDLMIAGKAGYDAERFKAAVANIAAKSGDAITRLFPDGSLDHPTRAKASIWTDWKAFAAEADRLHVYAGALDWIANTHGQAISSPGRGSAVGAGPPLSEDGYPAADQVKHLPPHTIFGYMKKMCQSCHDAFSKAER